MKGTGGPFIKRLHVYRYAAGPSVGGMRNFVAPLPASRPDPDEDESK